MLTRVIFLFAIRITRWQYAISCAIPQEEDANLVQVRVQATCETLLPGHCWHLRTCSLSLFANDYSFHRLSLILDCVLPVHVFLSVRRIAGGAIAEGELWPIPKVRIRS
jgi:hypothetical protein